MTWKEWGSIKYNADNASVGENGIMVYDEFGSGWMLRDENCITINNADTLIINDYGYWM